MATLDKGTTIRPSASALLTIDSEDRYKSYADRRAALFEERASSPFNFKIAGENVILSGFMTRIGVSEINFPWVIPNINLKTNKILVSLEVNTVPVLTNTVLTMSVGFYTPSQLAAQFQADVRALHPDLSGFVMTYGQNLGGDPSFSYGTGNPNVLIEFNPMDYNTIGYPFGNNCRQLFDVLGFSAESATFSSVGYGGYTLAQATRYVDIVCPQITGRQGLFDGSSQQIYKNALCRIYIGSSTNNTTSAGDETFAPPGTCPFVIHRMFPVPKMIAWDARTNIGTSLNFEVYDDEGNLLDQSLTVFNQSCDWSMTLLASEN